jgi:outer membrane usher protein FimD/PapC
LRRPFRPGQRHLWSATRRHRLRRYAAEFALPLRRARRRENVGDLGAFSVDVTRAKALLKKRKTSKGQSLRLRYSKNFIATGTHFSLAGYRYNSKGFYTLQDTMESWTSANDWSAPQQRRARAEATIDQTLGASGVR